MARIIMLLLSIENVIVGGSTALYMRGEVTTKPNDIDLLVNVNKVGEGFSILGKFGFKIVFDFPNITMFDLRRQYQKGDSKCDIFLVGENVPYDIIEGVKYAASSVVWAARGYYAAKGYTKAQNQLVETGYVVNLPKEKARESVSYPYPNEESDDMSRQSWERKDDLCEIAQDSSEEMKVGAIYTIDGETVSTGYNRSAAYCDHAEIVAIETYEVATGKRAQGGIMYCTLSGCSQCQKELRARNIFSVYNRKYTGKL